MKTPEDEAFDNLAKRQGDWGGGFPAKRAMAADKLQEPAQEPAEWLTGCPTCGIDAGCDCDTGTWNPPQREWVGLTDEEIWGVVSRIGTSNSDVNPHQTIHDARAIEAKLKEKNNGT